MSVIAPHTSLNLPQRITPSSPEGGINWREYYYAVRTRLWIVVLCVILFTAWGFQKASKQHWVYRARAVFLIKEDKPRILNNTVTEVTDDQIKSVDMINTLLDKFQSYPFALRVASRLKLAQDPEFLTTTGIASSEIPPEQAASMLTGMVNASFRDNTRLIDIFATTRNPKLSEKLANAYAQEYLYYAAEQQRETTHSAVTYLVDESKRLRDKMHSAEEGMQAFREREKAASIESMLQEAQSKLDAAAARQESIQSKLTQISKDLTIAQAHKDNMDELLRLPSVANDPKVSALVAELDGLEGELSIVKQRYRAKHPIYVNLQSRIDLTKQQLQKVLSHIVELLAAMSDNLNTEAKAVKVEREAAEKHLLDVTGKTIEYNDLKRELESDSALYSAVISRIKEVDMTKELAQSPLVLQEAAMGAAPIGKDPQMMIIQTILTGLALGIGVAILLHKLDSTMKTVDQVESTSGLVVVAAIPQVGYEEKNSAHFALGMFTHEQWRLIGGGFSSALDEIWKGPKRPFSDRIADAWDDIRPMFRMMMNPRRITALPPGMALPVKEDPSGMVAESFRSLRATVAMNVTKENQRSFLFTSALPSEGKSFSSANFAATLAHQGLRTLLIDADLRKPSLSRLFFGVHRKPGLSEVLHGTHRMEEAINVTGIDGLSLMTAGGRSDKPSELLAGEPFRDLMKQVLLSYDRVVVDSAPLLAVSDTLLVGHSVDILCLVVRSFMTPKKMVLRAIKLLGDIHVVPAGIVLNCLPSGAGAAYDYYYGRYYSYGKYGSYGSRGVYGSD